MKFLEFYTTHYERHGFQLFKKVIKFQKQKQFKLKVRKTLNMQMHNNV